MARVSRTLTYRLRTQRPLYKLTGVFFHGVQALASPLTTNDQEAPSHSVNLEMRKRESL